MKIAVIGSGISGNGAAWALSGHHDVTVYERDSRPGGHSATVDIEYDGSRIAVDTGFIVYNELNYPDLTALFHHLGVATRETAMSFAVSAPAADVEWSGRDLGTIFAQRRNLLRPAFVWMLREILRFNRQALADRAAGSLAGRSLGAYLDAGRYSTAMRTLYLEPMGAAIWSTPPRELRDFPAEMFVEFFDNHRLLHHRRPNWRTVVGGSRHYVERLVAPLRQRMRLSSDVVSIRRNTDQVEIIERNGRREIFDHVVIATHSDQALRLLADPSHAERQILGAIAYRPNIVYLHRDPDLMPRRRSVWSSWNYMCPNDADYADGTCSVSYWMNALQHIDPGRPLFVSLNPARPPNHALTFGAFEYHHPVFDSAALAAQNRLSMIQGVRNTWFCGAYHGRGFHEDGLRSGLAVASRLGARIPWREPAPSAGVALPIAAD
jgi:uncharacterized protein